MRYATLEDLQTAIEKENRERPFYSLNRTIDPKYIHSYQLARNDDDKSLIIQLSEGEVYLTEREKEKLWTITNPSELSATLASIREKAQGGEFCKNRSKELDKYSRPSNINTLNYYICAGDDPRIALDRENMVSRMADYPISFSRVPLGLTSQPTGLNPVSETYPIDIPLIDMGELSVPYGLSSMTSNLVKYIPPGLNM